MGKLIGGLIGWLAFGILGMLLGLWIGHRVDRARTGAAGFGGFRTHSHPDSQRLFFETLFRLLGHLAKADGRVSEAEIRQAEALMRQSRLTAEHRQEAIRLFNQGIAPDFDLQAQLTEFAQVCGRNARLKQILMVYLISMAHADGSLDQVERSILGRVAAGLEIPAMLLTQFINMVGAQTHFRSGGSSSAGHQPMATERELQLAYQALGVTESASDAEIKRAYRRLMSENHPDKLMGQGVPEDMIALATERSKEISRAYDLIRESRK